MSNDDDTRARYSSSVGTKDKQKGKEIDIEEYWEENHKSHLQCLISSFNLFIIDFYFKLWIIF